MQNPVKSQQNKPDPDTDLDFNQPSPDPQFRKNVSSMNWAEIARVFDEMTKNVHNIYFFLINIIEEKLPTSDAASQIFTDLERLNQFRISFLYDSFVDAQKYVRDMIDLSNYRKNFEQYKLDAHNLLTQIIKASTTKEARHNEDELMHMRHIEVIKELAKYPQGVNIKAAKSISDYEKRLSENSLSGTAQNLKEHNDQLRQKRDAAIENDENEEE